MAARIYSAPAEAGPAPVYDSGKSWEANEAAEAAYTDAIVALAKKASPTDTLAGGLFNYPHADGYARYVVWSSKPLTLIHLPLGDAWNVPAVVARGLRVADVRKSIEGAKRVAALFSKRADGW